MRGERAIKKLVDMYFCKNVLPFWCILLMDSVIVFLSCLFTYWISNRTASIFENRYAVVYTALLYTALSWIGARMLRTYSGIVRYSSFVDLMKVAYANAITLVLAVGCSLICHWQGLEAFTAITPLETISAVAIATLLMWGVRIVVKNVFDATNAKDEAVNAIIYGALSGGIGISKNIRSQSPRRFKLCGFIPHDHRMRDMQLMGKPVYTLEDDIAKVIFTTLS